MSSSAASAPGSNVRLMGIDCALARWVVNSLIDAFLIEIIFVLIVLIRSVHGTIMLGISTKHFTLVAVTLHIVTL